MGAIYKKEIRSMFLSPIAYVVISSFLVLAAIVFRFSNFTTDQNGALNPTSDMTGFFSNITIFISIIIAILSMRFFSEEKRTKTDQLLLTSPVSLYDIVIGKFLAGITVYAAALAASFIFIFIIMIYGTPQWGIILGSYLGLLLMGGALIAIGIFISSLTESQVISAVATFGVLFIMIFYPALANSLLQSFINVNSTIMFLINGTLQILAIYDKYQQFAEGMLDVTAIVYYLSIIAVFLFLTARVLEKRRWK